MRMGNQVEWGLHCVLTLASLKDGQRLSSRALAEFFEVPSRYLAKALQSLSNAQILETMPGPKGGYRLSKVPESIRMIDVVDAIEGSEQHFRCEEIRRHGPCRTLHEKNFRRACGVARAMWRADAAWRKELAQVTIADLIAEYLEEGNKPAQKAVACWLDENATT